MNLTNALIPALLCLAGLAFAGCCCYAVGCGAKYIKALTATVGVKVPHLPRRPLQPHAIQTPQEFAKEVESQTMRPCAECSTPFLGKICPSCGYVPPTSYSTRRTSFSEAKKRLENAEPTAKQRTS